MPNENKTPKKIHANGCYGAKDFNYGKDELIVKFKFYDNIIGECQTYSELAPLQFAAESYGRSCISLFELVDKYDDNKGISWTQECSYRYLPAMFCFRHFVELKLKCLYLYLYKESFDNNHTLKDFIGYIEQKGFSCPNFQTAYDYIDKYENGNPTYFRYLLTPKFRYQKQLKIKPHEYRNIRTMVQNINIEYQSIINQL